MYDSFFRVHKDELPSGIDFSILGKNQFELHAAGLVLMQKNELATVVLFLRGMFEIFANQP